MKDATSRSIRDLDRAPLGADDLGASLAMLLDELAHGLVLASPHGKILHVNQAARQELARGQALSMLDGHLQAADATQSRTLMLAVARAAAGRRSMVVLRTDLGASLGMVVMPLRSDADRQPGNVAVILSRAAVCDPLMLCFFARTHGLTNCEEQVLGILCQGYSAPEVALQLKVAVSTVRSHIRSLCAKTQTNGVRALVGRVAVLPPVGTTRLHERVH